MSWGSGDCALGEIPECKVCPKTGALRGFQLVKEGDSS